jgi:hypothetical protein
MFLRAKIAIQQKKRRRRTGTRRAFRIKSDEVDDLSITQREKVPDGDPE